MLSAEQKAKADDFYRDLDSVSLYIVLKKITRNTLSQGT